ncbi:dihydroxy-acid dehydratase [Microbacterium rhizomatis]|uniref:Dihydroxy-acid dehydratase n=1 Tax=Microbacterium rhizomatis TaxID=1631477 RepID=A0A5J5J275_9MICO|nr:dihydroxy-acid dehydratase [Microbacterium rhizomatis]KAA9108114.1 dihydroxy-acid dehydratase [Microbacterium rhizomatis]
MTALRSSAWFDGDDEVALAHRVAVRMGGGEIEQGERRPIVAVIDTSSDANPCNLPLRELAEHVRRGVTDAGGTAMVMPAMSLGEDLMKPSAMLYRNLLSMEVEELLRANPIDGVVLLTNCDKTTPGALMGAISSDLPTIQIIGGNRPAPVFDGRELGTGTDLWREMDRYRSGEIDRTEWRRFEACYACGTGSCNTAGTASSMAMIVEALGFALPGASTVQAGQGPSRDVSYETGRRIVAMIDEGLTPSRILSEASLRNAARILQSVGGSTNAVIHLAAIAGRAGIVFGPEQVAAAGAGVPVIADVQPSGAGLMRELDRAGGVPSLVFELGDLIEPEPVTCTGKSLRASGRAPLAANESSAAIRTVSDPIVAGPAIRAVSGTLAPGSAVIKAAASDPRLWRHRGPALVFHGYDEMRERTQDLDLDVTADHVLVLSGCGPVGVPGMPEWGMIPIPKRLLQQGVTDMVRISDARMSGTSFGTVFLHVSPEGAVGGPIALVRDGDMISVDVEAGSIELEVSPEELDRRRGEWVPPVSAHLRGWPLLYQQHVEQADRGADLDFLTAPTAAHRRRVDPVVGRS